MKSMLNFRLLLFEIRYQLSQPQFWAAGVFFLLLGFGFSRITLGGDGVWVNAPYSITFNMQLLSLLSVFVVTMLTARTGLRDHKTGMAPIVKSAPFPRWNQKLHAIIGLVIAILLILFLSAAGMIIGSFTVDANTFPAGPFQPRHYLVPFLLFVIPNTVLMVVFQFLVAQKTGYSFAVYLSGIGIYIGYFVISILGDSPLIAGSSPDPHLLFWAGILDPFGLTAFLEQTQHWTVEQMNVQTIELKGSILYNRIFWMGVTFLTAIPGLKRRSRKPGSGENSLKVNEIDPPRFNEISVKGAPQCTQGWKYNITAVIDEGRIQLLTLIKSRAFAIAAILWMALVVMELSDSIGDGPFDTPFYALSELIIPSLFSPFQVVGSLIIIFFTSELVWNTRTVGIYHLTDATPASNSTRFGSVMFTSAVMVCLLVTLTLLPAAGYQLLKGEQPDLLLSLGLFLYPGIPWMLSGVFTTGIQTFSPDKYLGMFAAAVMMITWPPVLEHVFEIRTYLLQYARAPELDYSIFAGFGPFLQSYGWYMLYWSLLATIFGIVAVKGWKRGVPEGVYIQLKRILQNIDTVFFRSLITVFVLFFISGGYIFLSKADNGYSFSPRQEKRWKASYELYFSRYSQLAKPGVQSVNLTADLFPGKRRYRVEGWYGVHNRTNVPVDSLLVGWDKRITNREINVDSVKPDKEYSRFNHFLFVLDDPLQPGDSTRINFNFRVDQSAFTEYDPNHAVIKNGSFIRLERFLPWLGYNTGLQLEDPNTRTRYELPKDPPVTAATLGDHRSNMKADYTLTVSTSSEQDIAAPGTPVKSWNESGRNYFQFTSTDPMRMRYAIASAGYKWASVNVDEISVQLLYHPSHEMNISLLRDASRTSMKILQELYGEYTRPSLTIAEIPSYHSDGIAATSYPGVIFFREHGGYTGDFRSLDEGDINYLYRRTAHELAHQWWGDQLNPDRTVPGAPFLTEAIAEYSAAIILKRIFGEETYQELIRHHAEQYLRYRTRIGNPTSLLEVTGNNDYIAYFKGPIVLNAVAEMIGENRLLRILRHFIHRYKDGVTAGDFYKQLKAHTPDRYHSMLKQWFRGMGNDGLNIDELR